MNAKEIVDYNKYLLIRLKSLLDVNKNEYIADLHVHTGSSVDGEGTIKDKLRRAVENNIDIIAIADHDSINAYNELYQLFKNNRDFIDKMPIVIPGVEYSVYYESYIGLCHVLQYFVNPRDTATINRLHRNKQAYWERAKIQFQRIKKNEVLNYLMDITGVNLEFIEYKNYLKKNNCTHPEYPSLIDYIYCQLKNANISMEEIINKCSKDIEKDSCESRKNLRRELFTDLMNRHSIKDFEIKPRLLTKIFAPLGVDDKNYLEEKPIGCLSVECYNQINIRELVNGLFVLAHPDVSRLNLLVDEIPYLGTDICGYEINKRNRKSNVYDIKECADKISYIVTYGSDSHMNDDDLYNDMSFYKYSKKELEIFYKKGVELLTKNV